MFNQLFQGLSLYRLFKTAIKQFVADQMSIYATALAFQMFFSLFPFLLFLVTLLGYLHLTDLFRWLEEQARLMLPEQAMSQVELILEQLQQQHTKLFSFSIIAALWTSSAAMRSMMDATNRAYRVSEGRPPWKRIPLSLLYTITLVILLVAATALMLIGPQWLNWLADYLGLGEAVTAAWALLRWPLAVLLMVAGVALIYWAAPDVQQRFRFITTGSLVSVLVWIGTSQVFAYYAKTFGRFNAMYGSIAAVIILMLYFYISAIVLLFGVELNVAIEHNHPQGKKQGQKRLPPRTTSNATASDDDQGLSSP